MTEHEDTGACRRSAVEGMVKANEAQRTNCLWDLHVNSTYRVITWTGTTFSSTARPVLHEISVKMMFGASFHEESSDLQALLSFIPSNLTFVDILSHILTF